MNGQHLYVIQMSKTGAIKVGRSGDPERRLRQLQTGCPYRLRLILVALDQGHLERSVHHAMRPYQTRYGDGEWFHERGMGYIPEGIWEQALPWVLENPDWWKKG
jgi:hypothetical protein